MKTTESDGRFQSGSCCWFCQNPLRTNQGLNITVGDKELWVHCKCAKHARKVLDKALATKALTTKSE